jgi:hypothetical protein
MLMDSNDLKHINHNSTPYISLNIHPVLDTPTNNSEFVITPITAKTKTTDKNPLRIATNGRTSHHDTNHSKGSDSQCSRKNKGWTKNLEKMRKKSVALEGNKSEAMRWLCDEPVRSKNPQKPDVVS